MGNPNQIRTENGDVIQKGETHHAETLRYHEFKQINSGTAEDLLSDEATTGDIKKLLENPLKDKNNNEVFGIWERSNITLLTGQKQQMHEIMIMINN